MKDISDPLTFRLFLIDDSCEKIKINWHETQNYVPQHLFNKAELVETVLNSPDHKYAEELTKGL